MCVCKFHNSYSPVSHSDANGFVYVRFDTVCVCEV